MRIAHWLGRRASEESIALDGWPELSLPRAADTICPVHGRPVEPVEVPVRYGHPARVPSTWRVRRYKRRYAVALRSSFPYTAPMVLGGCVLPEDDERRVQVECACPDCVRAEESWCRFHRPPA